MFFFPRIVLNRRPQRLSDLDQLVVILFDAIVVAIIETLLEQGGRRSAFDLRPNDVIRSSGYVRWNIFLLVGFVLQLVVFFLTDGVRIAWVAGNVSELTFISVRVHVAVLAAYNAVGATGFFFKTPISGFVAKGKRSVVVDFIVVA